MIPPKQFEIIKVPGSLLGKFFEKGDRSEDETLEILYGLDSFGSHEVVVVWTQYEETPEESLTLSVVYKDNLGFEQVCTLAFFEDNDEEYDEIEYTGHILELAEVLTHPLRAVREAGQCIHSRGDNE